MPVVTKTRLRYILPVNEFRAFIANQLGVNAIDILEISKTDNDAFWQVIMQEVE